MERKNIKNIRQIWNGKRLLTNNFSNLNLEGIDLSKIPAKFWKNCIFNNTNFKNTGIKFRPFELKKTYGKYGKGIYMCDCDFSDNDLSYLNVTSFRYSDGWVHIDGCTFKNVNTNFLFVGNLNNVTLDESFDKYGYDDFDRTNVDLATIKNNPFLNIPSYQIVKILYDYVTKKEMIEDKEKLVKELEDILNFDKQGDYKRFYNLFKENFSLDDKLNFFKRKIKDKHIKNLDFTDVSALILNMFDFENNIFDNVVIDKPLNELVTSFPYYDDEITKNDYKLLKLPKIKYDSWQENEGAKNRISNSQITFLTKVYVELSRICNANCLFCRNKSFEKCNYDLKRINETLNMIRNYINIIVIGGGEPTLRLDDIKYLYDEFNKLYNDVSWRMFTNGTNPDFICNKSIPKNIGINLSRHATNDLENAKIFGVSPSNIMTANDIEKLIDRNRNTILSATCFKGGLDSYNKIIDYINFAQNLGCRKILLTDLNNDFSMGNKDYSKNLTIDPSIFNLVIIHLQEMGYKMEYPIYATGGYVAYIFENKEGFTITIQSYITKEELDKSWESSVKRAFDLSIDPSGNLYENWHQKSEPVKSIGRKK